MNRKLVLFALACAVVAAPVFAASYVVPPDDVFIGKSDAIVIARALTSYSRATANGNIETVTEFSITETAKGFVAPNFEVRIPGGVLADRVELIAGAPSFAPGTDYLLFLRNLPDGGFVSTDFGLGVFAFDDNYERRTVRRTAEIFGWDLDGGTHLEFQRDAGAFLRYIRSVAAGASPVPDYVTSIPASGGSFRPAAPMVTALSFTGTSYTITCGGGGEGCTWAGFPVTFNQGNTEPGAPGPAGQEGKTAITTACASWNGAGAGINYSLTTFNANTNGILNSDPSDHVNNVVFERNLTSVGASAYSCAGGGTLGIGGIKTASGSHLHAGETYVTTSEVDVSMNQGIANCTSLFNSGDFNTAVTHEVGHTLGFRHSDQTRADNPSVACSTDPSLDCSSSAVMRASIPHNISGALQAWDLSAAQTVYGSGPVCTPASISVQPAGTSISSGQSTSLSVTAAGTAPLSYQWYVGASGDTSSPIGGATGTSVNVSPTTTTSYWVKVTNSCNVSGANSNAATVTVTACNPPQVTSQPTGSTITFGSSTQVSVVASGTAPLTYQWYVGAKGNTSSPVFNGTTASISVNPQSTTSYWVRVSGACAPPADSNAATVTVNCLAPQVSATPASRTITQGSSTLFSAIATGGPNMTLQWYQGIAPDTSNPVAGQTGSSITVSPSASTSYWVQATVSGCGTSNSNTVVVTVNPNNGCPPVTVTTPTVTQNGVNYTLATTATTGNGGGTVTITWYQQTNSGQTAIGTGPSVVVSPTVTTSYLAQASNTCGSTNSAPVTVTIAPSGCTGPAVTQPSDQTIGRGSSTTITVSATGTPTLHYQWYLGAAGDTSVPVGNDSATLITGALTATNTYWVKVTNDCGNASSTTVTITVEIARRRSVHH